MRSGLRAKATALEKTGQTQTAAQAALSFQMTRTDEEKNMVNPIQIQKFLKGVDYPASKSALIENAKNMGADENVCASLEKLPEEDFQTPADVSQAFGRMRDDIEGDGAAQAGAQSAGHDAGVQEFLADALEDSMAEVELCEMALEKSSNDEIKMFAQHMIDDHSRIGQEIEKLAGKSPAKLPQQEKPEYQALMQELSGLSGVEFDRRFIDHNVADHEKDIKVFRHYAQTLSDQGVKSFAEKSVRTLEQHCQMAKDLQQKLKS